MFARTPMNEVRPCQPRAGHARHFWACVILPIALVCWGPGQAAAVEITLRLDTNWTIERHGDTVAIGTKLQSPAGDTASTASYLKLVCLRSDGQVRLTVSVSQDALKADELSGHSIVANFDSETPVDLPVEISTEASRTSITASSGVDGPPGLQLLILALRNYDTIQFRIGSTDFTFEPRRSGSASGGTNKKEALSAILDTCESVLQ